MDQSLEEKIFANALVKNRNYRRLPLKQAIALDYTDSNLKPESSFYTIAKNIGKDKKSYQKLKLKGVEKEMFSLAYKDKLSKTTKTMFNHQEDANELKALFLIDWFLEKTTHKALAAINGSIKESLYRLARIYIKEEDNAKKENREKEKEYIKRLNSELERIAEIPIEEIIQNKEHEDVIKKELGLIGASCNEKTKRLASKINKKLSLAEKYRKELAESREKQRIEKKKANALKRKKAMKIGIAAAGIVLCLGGGYYGHQQYEDYLQKQSHKIVLYEKSLNKATKDFQTQKYEKAKKDIKKLEESVRQEWFLSPSRKLLRKTKELDNNIEKELRKKYLKGIKDKLEYKWNDFKEDNNTGLFIYSILGLFVLKRIIRNIWRH